MIRVIPTSQVRDYWPRVVGLLEPAIIAGRRATADETLKWLERGDYQLWVSGTPHEIEAAATTAISTYPGSKWLCVVHCGGKNMWKWLQDGVATLEAWARGNGCVGVEIIGRVEWGRVLDGYETTAVLIQKKFADVEERAA